MDMGAASRCKNDTQGHREHTAWRLLAARLRAHTRRPPHRQEPPAPPSCRRKRKRRNHAYCYPFSCWSPLSMGEADEDLLGGGGCGCAACLLLLPMAVWTSLTKGSSWSQRKMVSATGIVTAITFLSRPLQKESRQPRHRQPASSRSHAEWTAQLACANHSGFGPLGLE